MNTTATPAAFPHLDELERASPDSIESFRQALATGDKQLQERFAQEEPVEHLVRDRARLSQELRIAVESISMDMGAVVAIDLATGALGEADWQRFANLYAFCGRTGDQALALRQHKKALEIREKVFGEDHPAGAVPQ